MSRGIQSIWINVGFLLKITWKIEFYFLHYETFFVAFSGVNFTVSFVFLRYVVEFYRNIAFMLPQVCLIPEFPEIDTITLCGVD